MTRQIGSYILSEQIAVSDVGTVWRGYDRGGGGPVHIKVGEPRVAELRASKVGADEVGQSGVVTVRDSFVSEEGAPVLVTNPPQGRCVAAAYASYDGAHRQVAHLIREAALTLKAFHDAGMTHGDISERTIWIDDADLPVFAEFGMGIRMEALPSSEPKRKGSEGREREFKLNQRADLFALGTVMYLLLSGQKATDHPPAEMSNPHSPADDIASIDTVAPEAPTELRAICGQLLATDPVHRYLDADTLVRDLDAYLHGKRSTPAVKLGFFLIGALLVSLFGIWGVTGGGPARIVDVSLSVRRGANPSEAYKNLATADHASFVGDNLSLKVVLSKPSNVAVFYLDPTGKMHSWGPTTPTRSGERSLTIPSNNGWRVPPPGGVGVLVVVSADDPEQMAESVQLELMSAGKPPQTYNAITWRGKNLSRQAEQSVKLNVGSSFKKERWKSFEPYADQLIKNILPVADDVAIGWVYVIGP